MLDSSQGLSYNPEFLDNLKQMGFSNNRAVRALIQNQNDQEKAITWLVNYIDDECKACAVLDDSSALDLPLESQINKVCQISEENVESLMGMGFSSALSKRALQNCVGQRHCS